MTPAYPPGDWEEVTDPEYVIQTGDWVSRGADGWEMAKGLVGKTVCFAAECCVPYRVIRPRRAAQETSQVTREITLPDGRKALSITLKTSIHDESGNFTWSIGSQKEPAMKLFIVAVIYTPKHEDLAKAAPEPALIVEPEAVLAKDEATARLKGAALVTSPAYKLDQCEVLVRPF